MRRIIFSALALLGGSVAMAQLQYLIVDTAQDDCFDTQGVIKAPKRGGDFYGQDAQHEGNIPSYTDNGDGTVTDNVTGLMWQKEYQVISLDEAHKMAKTFELAGHSDWRVPSIKEAYSLILFSGVDASSRNWESVPEGAIPFIDTEYFAFKYGSNGTRVIDTQMISSTMYVGSLGQRMELVFGVNIADGRIKGYPKQARNEAKSFTVRFVRGAEYGVNDFKDNRDGTISDHATGLMWQKDDSGKGLDWPSALEYAEKMNQKNYLGHDDWRVPDAKELQSIVDYTRSPETSSSAAIDPIFDITKIKNEAGERDYPFFWSSTTHMSANLRSIGGAAAYVCFGRGLGNMQMGQMQGGGGQGRGGMQGGGRPQMQGGGQGGRQGGQGGHGGGQRPAMGGGGQSSGTPNWINIHGAGCQRSDTKVGNASDYAGGRGPQGDAIRIENYVRLVRNI